MQITKNDLYNITLSLSKEYSDKEIKAMLDTAIYTKTNKRVLVEYDNGVVDTFIYIKQLIHQSDINLNTLK